MRDFEVIIVEGAFPSAVAATRDMLATAAALAVRVGAPKPSFGVYSLQGGIVSLQGGLLVETARLPRTAGANRPVWILPGLGIPNPQALLERLERDDARAVAKRIAAHVRAGGRVAASCSSVFLLQAAGVLAGRHVTTSWWLAPQLAQLAIDCVVDADRMVVDSGAVITAGASFAHTDLMLYLLRQRFGSALCDAVARMLLLDGRHAQAGFVIPEMLASGHTLVAQLTARVESSLPNTPSIAALASELHVSERTLARHVRQATGRSTTGLVQSVKLRRARALLENSRMNIDQIAAAVGYQDATALRRLMRKAMGATPSQFRTTGTQG